MRSSKVAFKYAVVGGTAAAIYRDEIAVLITLILLTAVLPPWRQREESP